MKDCEDGKVRNPETNRCISKEGKVYKNLMKKGVIGKSTKKPSEIIPVKTLKNIKSNCNDISMVNKLTELKLCGKELNIKGYYNMRKADLYGAILNIINTKPKYEVSNLSVSVKKLPSSETKPSKQLDKRRYDLLSKVEKLEMRNVCENKTWTKSKMLGRGVYGEVYISCYDKTLDCSYVLKIQKIDLPSLKSAFMNEVKNLKILNTVNPQLSPRMFDFWKCDKYNEGYIIMELIEGETLRKYIEKILKDHDSDFVSQFYKAYDVTIDMTKDLHKVGMYHLDLHTNNMMLDDSRTTKRLLILDFGISAYLKDASKTFFGRCFEIYDFYRFSYDFFNIYNSYTGVILTSSNLKYYSRYPVYDVLTQETKEIDVEKLKKYHKTLLKKTFPLNSNGIIINKTLDYKPESSLKIFSVKQSINHARPNNTILHPFDQYRGVELGVYTGNISKDLIHRNLKSWFLNYTTGSLIPDILSNNQETLTLFSSNLLSLVYNENIKVSESEALGITGIVQSHYPSEYKKTSLKKSKTPLRITSALYVNISKVKDRYKLLNTFFSAFLLAGSVYFYNFFIHTQSNECIIYIPYLNDDIVYIQLEAALAVPFPINLFFYNVGQKEVKYISKTVEQLKLDIKSNFNYYDF